MYYCITFQQNIIFLIKLNCNVNKDKSNVKPDWWKKICNLKICITILNILKLLIYLSKNKFKLFILFTLNSLITHQATQISCLVLLKTFHEHICVRGIRKMVEIKF